MTTDRDESFRSLSGSPETAEPASTTTTTTATTATTTTPSASVSAAAAATPSEPVSKAPVSAAASSSDNGPVPTRHQTLNGVRSLNVSGSPSTAGSPMSSRDTSPARLPQRITAPSSGPPLPKSARLSRKSSTDVSPNRGSGLAGPGTTVPSAAAIQRALSSANIPQLSPAATQDPSRVPRPLKSASGTNSGDNTPHLPVSPRFKSPPPVEARSRSRRNSLRSQQKKPEPTPTPTPTPSIVVQSSSPGLTTRVLPKDDVVMSDPEEPHLSMKTSSRGASGAAPKLETVQESSLPTTPSFEALDAQSFLPSSINLQAADEDRHDVTTSKVTEDLTAKGAKNVEGGGDNGTKSKLKMQEQRSTSTQRPIALTTKPSHSSLHTAKPRTEAPSRNMTVETETVPSVPQASIGNQDRSASGRPDGSLRLKPSNETIRPRKERRTQKRKAPSINSGTGRSPIISYQHHHHHPSRPELEPRSSTATSLGSPISYRSVDDRRSLLTVSPPSPRIARRLSARSPSLKYFYHNTNMAVGKASSKADVFEQKVASEVNEADSSDSDATFIYESNPPDQQPHRSRHHHSRTPSITSIASIVNPQLALRDAHKNPDKKPSMKFANPYNNGGGDFDAERADGTIRVGSGRVSGGRHHHHIGRYGQGRGALSHLVMDSDSSMAQSSRARAPSSRHPSQPNSPRFHPLSVSNGNGIVTKKQGEFSTYDIDTENAADDERTPLISSRSPRARTPRRPNSAALRHIERRHRREGSWCRRFAGCLVASIIILVVVFTAIGVVFASTKPLIDVKIHEIQNVVASQEEIILDLVVGAINPNIVGVTVQDMDVIMFAKSKHVGSDKWWREHGSHQKDEGWLPIKASSQEEPDLVVAGVDEGTDPIGDPDIGVPLTMSLGHIFHFDSPLSFDGTFFNHRLVESVGEIRLSKPGNKTEAGGTARWEEVLQYPFELILEGNFKYQLPLSTHEHKVPVTASYYYDPDIEKKKLKMLDFNQRRKKKELSPTPVISEPLGRFDRRVLSLHDWRAT